MTQARAQNAGLAYVRAIQLQHGAIVSREQRGIENRVRKAPGRTNVASTA